REVTRLLHTLGKNDERSIIDAELGMIGARLRAGEIGITDARDLLWPLHDHPDATDEEVMVVYDVTDSISYALYEGIGDLQEVETRLSKFLARYIDQLTLNDD